MAEVNILFCLEIWGTCLGLWGLARTPLSPFPLFSFPVKRFIKLCPGFLPTSPQSSIWVRGAEAMVHYTLGGRTSYSSLAPQPLLGSMGTLAPVVWPSKQSLVSKTVGVTWWLQGQAAV